MTRDELIAAWQQGRDASLGDENPYAGAGIAARMWRRGYRRMMLDVLTSSPAARLYESKRTD